MSGRSVLILYGSETGITADLAQSVSETCERLRLSPQCLAMNDFPAQMLPVQEFVIFLTSTTGQGDMPENITTFWRTILRKRIPKDWLEDVKVACFGVGDSSYSRFCWAAKKLRKRLVMLGADEAVEYREGDEQAEGGLDSAFIEWKKELREALLEEFPLEPDEEEIAEETPLPPKWLLQFDEEDLQPHPEDGTILRPNSVAASVVENKRVTPSNHWQAVREISLNLSPPSEYSPGDTVSIMPPNPSDAVDTFISLQDWPQEDLDRKLILSPTQYLRRLYPDSVPPMPPITLVQPLTLRNIVKHHLDLLSIPRRSFFSYMQPLTNDKIHKERIAEFVDPNNLDDLWDYTIRPKRTLIEVLQEFNSVKIDYKTILNGGFPIIHPRLFSVASSASEAPLKDSESTSSPASTNVKLIVAILSYKTIIAKPRRGLSTTYLSQLQPSSALSIILSSPQSKFSPPDTVPAIMIAAGTGIAPMRSLILDRSSRGVGISDDILFYGGRGPDVDFYFREDWERLGLNVYAAWSRVEGQKRKYVQEEVVNRREAVKERLARGGWVLVCGKRGAFVKGVEEAFDLILKEGRGSWAKLEAEGRVRVEAW